MAVPNVQAAGVSGDVAKLLTEILKTEIAELGDFRLITGPLMEEMLGLAAEDLVKCADEDCLYKLGHSLGADLVVACHAGRVGNTLVLHMKLLDVHRQETIDRAYETFEEPLDALLKRLRVSARHLMKRDGTDRSAAGPLEVPVGTAPPGLEATSAGVENEAPTAWRLPAALASAGVGLVGLGTYFGYATQAHYDGAMASDGALRRRHNALGQRSQWLANGTCGVGAALLVASGVAYVMGGGDSSAEAAQTGITVVPEGTGSGGHVRLLVRY